MSYEKIVLVGNLGKDPEMSYTSSGNPVTNFSLATNRQYTNNNGEKVKVTTWWKVSAWGRTGEICNQYLKVGSKVLIEGRLNPDPETGSPRVFQRQDGTHGSSYELTADRVVFMGDRGTNDIGDQQGSFEEYPIEEDDIPF